MPCMPLSGPNETCCTNSDATGGPNRTSIWTLCPFADVIEELDQDFDGNNKVSDLPHPIPKAAVLIDVEGDGNCSEKVSTRGSRLLACAEHKDSRAGGL